MEDEKDGADNCREAAVKSEIGEIPNATDAPCQRLVHHDHDDFALGGALFALTFRAESPHGDQGRLHVDQGGAVVEAFLRLTLRIPCFRSIFKRASAH